MIKKYKNYLLVFILLVILMEISFGNLPKTFFQQDEWQYFGAYVSALSSTNPFFNIVLPYQGGLTHFFPLGQLLFFIEFVLFGINFYQYAYVGLFLHLINALLVFILIKKIIEKKIIAFLTSTLFLTNSIAHQPVTWILAGLGTLPSTACILLSIIFFIDFLKKNNNRLFKVSILLLFIALLFKEIALFLFLFYPLLWILFGRKKEMFAKTDIKPFFILAGTGLFYVLFRFVLIIYNISGIQPETTNQSSATLISYIYRFFTVPFKGLPQSFIPQGTLIKISDAVVRLTYPQFVATDGVANPFISQSIVLDLVCYFLSAIILFISLLIFLYFKKNEKAVGRGLLFGLFLIATSLFPFIFVAGKAGYYSIFEPRNLYVAMIGSSLAVSIFCYFLACLITENVSKRKVITILLVLPYLLLSIITVRRDVSQLESIGQLRRSFLQEIQEKYPSLPIPVAFYVESDSPYYGMPEEEKILPVQSGFGRMLMIWYQARAKYPSCLYADQYLYDLLSQGYKFCDNKGFGYFRQYDKLVNEVKESKIPINNIIGFFWSERTKDFTDITISLRKTLYRDL